MDKLQPAVLELPHFARPESDNQQLLNMQFEYKKGDRQALASMYTKLYEVAYKTINSRSRTNAHVAALSDKEREKKAHDAATYIIEQYLKRPAFVITDSVTGYLYKRVTWELCGCDHQRKCDQMVTYTDELPERQGGKTAYRYLVKDLSTGETAVYNSAAELYQVSAFSGLRKKRLAEAIRTGRKWKHYTFDILEVQE